MSHFDPHTNKCELEVQRIIHLQNLANQLPNAFIDTKKVTKSHIPAANAPVWIDVLERQLKNESKIHLKRGRTIGSKDITPWKRRIQRELIPLKRYMIKKRPLYRHMINKKPLKRYMVNKRPL